MDRPFPDPPPTLSLSQAQRVNDVCDGFEAEWRAGRRPDIETALALATDRDRREVFRELLVLEIEIRRKIGEQPSANEYHDRFPEWASEVREVLGESLSPSPVPSWTETKADYRDQPTIGCDSTPRAPEESPVLGLFGDYELLAEIAGEGWAWSTGLARKISTGSSPSR